MAESKEEMDYWRIISLLYKVAPSAVRVTFDKEFHPRNGLEAALKQDKWRVLEPLKRKRIIHQVQWDLLFPISGKLGVNPTVYCVSSSTASIGDTRLLRRR